MKIPVVCFLAVTLLVSFTLGQRHEAEEANGENGYGAEGSGQMNHLLQELREILGLSSRRPEEEEFPSAEAEEMVGMQGLEGIRRHILLLRREVSMLRKMLERSRYDTYGRYRQEYTLE
ncbi:hypothetical protein AAHC03_025783 [Spirometra sp. Aus1]